MADDREVHRPAEGGDLIAPPPGPGPAAALPGVRAISAALASFADAGCAVTDGLLACQVTIPPIQSAGIPHAALIEAVAGCADVYLRFQREETSFELSRTAGSDLEFTSGPDGDADSVFAGEELAGARLAWQGNVEAALSLCGEWRGDLSVNLAAPLQQQEENGDRAWRAVRRTAVITTQLAAYPWWRTGELIRAGQRPVVIAVTDEDGVLAQTPAFAVVSLDQLTGTGPSPGGPTPGGLGQRREQVQASSAGQLPDGLPLPEELDLEAVVGAGPLADALRPLADALRPRAEACAWAWLSNAARVTGDRVTLEFFGYRRRAFSLGPAGYTGQDGQRALRMYTRATAESSPDRVLAIRQVVSLYEQDELPGKPEDIVRAAEPLYQALRAGEVAAVLDSQREARSSAVDAASQSADAAQGAAKAATERTIASLAAVAGIAVANATAVLSAADSRAIAIGIAAIFLFLAGWAIFIEGPMLKEPLDSFRADLPVIGHLLPPGDQAAILGMRALRKAEEAAGRVRVAAPCVYAAGAVITLGVAWFKFGLRVR
ncbi:MAG TPA: hypothetical protein VGL63_16650 [Streptosporangiaceae bacterium]